VHDSRTTVDARTTTIQPLIFAGITTPKMNLPILLLTAAAFGHIFVLWLHGNRMWNTEHYSFFPLGIAAAVLIWNQRREEIANSANKANPFVAGLLLGSAVITTVLATLLTSGFFGWLSLMLFLLGFLYAFFGSAGTWKSIPVLVMLLAITPLPALLDQKLILSMQHFASLLASTGLDVFGIIHVRQGVVLVSTTQSFLAEEACSGIRSLFSTLAGIVFWGLLHRYPIWRHAVNFLQAIFWVLVYNAARIMTVVMVEDWTDFSIASGWKHDFLGFIVFFIIAGTVLSTDRLIRAFFPLSIVDEELDEVSGEKRRVPTATKALWRFPIASMPDPRIVYAFVGLFALAGILGLRMFTLAPRVATIAGKLPALIATSMPEEIGEWKVTEFREVNRGRGDLQGEKSFVWKLTSGERTISVSVDGDWADYHDLGECYSGMGWQASRQFFYPSLRQLASGDETDSSPEVTRLDLKRLTGENGIGFFSSVDRTGKVVLPQSYLGNETGIYIQEKLMTQLGEAFGFGRSKLLRETTFSPPVSTIQMVYFPKGPLDDVTIDALQRLYLDLRKVLARDPRFGGSTVQ